MHNLEQIRTGNRRLGEHKRFLSPKKYPHRNRRYYMHETRTRV